MKPSHGVVHIRGERDKDLLTMEGPASAEVHGGQLHIRLRGVVSAQMTVPLAIIQQALNTDQTQRRTVLN